MIIKPTTGVIRTGRGTGSRFAEQVINRYRRLGDFFYHGTSLTFLKNDAGTRQEIVTRHPIYITLQLLTQKLYLEQNRLMVLNSRLYRETVERQLSRELELIRREYHALYPQMRRLERQVNRLAAGGLSSVRERSDMRLMLSVQMKRLRGLEPSAMTEEEQAFLRYGSSAGPKGRQPGSRRWTEEAKQAETGRQADSRRWTEEVEQAGTGRQTEEAEQAGTGRQADAERQAWENLPAAIRETRLEKETAVWKTAAD